MLWRTLRIGVLVLVPVLALWAGRRQGQAAVALGAVAVWLLLGVLPTLLPRFAHRAFVRGQFGRAGLLYRLLYQVALDRRARAALAISVAACDLARERYRRARRRLERVRPADLDDALRAAWLNNRAYAAVRGDGDAAEALADADGALALRPAVPGFRHTRGIALLALGQIEDAIRELDSLWTDMAAEAPPLLEAERCYDLGRAWERQGERDYATDYFQRARRAAPESAWAALATRHLDLQRLEPPIALDFLEA